MGTSSVAVPARGRRGSELWARLLASPWLLLAPAAIALAAVAAYPLIYGVRASFHAYRYGRDVGSAGLENYRAIFEDHTFWTALGTTAKYVALAVSIETLLGLGLALLVASQLRFSRFIRVSLVLPMTVAPVVVGVIWRLMYASDIGVVNPLFSALGLGKPNVLANPGSAFLGVVAVDVWEWTPLLFLIILAGLQSLPQEPIEAARVDGAGPVRVFFDHTLPLLRPVLMVAVVLRLIDAVGTFDQIFVLTKGGPGTATQLISTYSYNTAFQFTQYGRGMAMVVSLLVLVLLLTIVAIKLMRNAAARTSS
ncbi:MAG: sugar ABC transporter permease [Thermoleophilaceae bacterium]|nr:sugar ABC transporter permease [Thermoleophilaceae bacterium]